jgi:eukaryotic-like serine/threonine-protein kinase
VALSPGSHVGPYEVVSPVGAGGMGEVYRARDPRLARDVALKVLPSGRGSNGDRLRRFENEARAVAALDHPRILAVHDVDTGGDVPYVVFELLEGETLRERLAAGPLPPRKAVELGVQMCQGLAAAHARGIVHRDLKPENLFLSRGHGLKILDFGLAKLTLGREGEEGGSPRADTTTTQPGVLVGTVGYLSPEQVRGQPADARSDVFAAGVVLYEMISGRRPFLGDSHPETLAAILKQDPQELESPFGPLSPNLDRIVRRCLEKDPEDRFQSARDVAFALEALSGSSPAAVGAVGEAGEGRRFSVRVGVGGLAALVIGGLVLVAPGPITWWLGRRPTSPALPTLTQLTFRRGLVEPARFSPDGRTVVLSALWDGRPSELLRMRLEDLEPEPIGLAGARLLSVSSQTELAVLLGRPGESGSLRRGTLARVSLSGGQPRRLAEHVLDADWSPHGRDLAVLRLDPVFLEPPPRLEYPVGTVLADGIVGAQQVRVHPSGERVAVRTHGAVLIFDRSGRQHRLDLQLATSGMAWDRGGEGLWLSAGSSQSGRSVARGVWRVTLDGRAREVYRVAGGLVLDDVSADGRILAHLGTVGEGVRVKAPGETRERELSTSGHAQVREISADGALVLTAEVLPRSVQAWLRPTRGGSGTRVVSEPPTTDVVSMTPDARWVLVRRPPPDAVAAPGRDGPERQLVLVPTGPGEPQVIPTGPVGGDRALGFMYFDDEDTIVAYAVEGGRKVGTWGWSLAARAWRRLTPPGVAVAWIRGPLGEIVGADLEDGLSLVRCPRAGGPCRPFPLTIPPHLSWVARPSDGRFGYLLVRPWFSVPALIERLDLTTGARRPGWTFQPQDATGITSMDAVFREGTDAYAYSYTRSLQDLYLIELPRR